MWALEIALYKLRNEDGLDFINSEAKKAYQTRAKNNRNAQRPGTGPGADRPAAWHSDALRGNLVDPFHLPDGTRPVRAMDPVYLPVAGIPGRDAQGHPPVIKFQDMLESIAYFLRLLVGHRINISIADFVEALPGFFYALDLDFTQVVRKIPVIGILEVLKINVEIGFPFIHFVH
jgi:hypothetical protein